jgi:hypothetical protein
VVVIVKQERTEELLAHDTSEAAQRGRAAVVVIRFGYSFSPLNPYPVLSSGLLKNTPTLSF